jgi:LytS/YehU family sensor histidine kinase
MLLVLRDFIAVPPEYIVPQVIVYGLSAAAGMVVTYGLRLVYRLIWERALLIRFLVAWFASLIAAAVWQPIRNYIAYLPFGEIYDLSNASPAELFDGVFSVSFPLLILWSSLYFIIKYYFLLQAEKEKSLRSEALAHQAQLLMLRYQLNPHFLFNTLNAISTLILTQSTEKANEMVTKLSKFLRYSLDHSPLDQVTLAHELSTSQLYLDIEKVRFGDRLQIEVEVEEQALGAMVPTLLLQPVIENSIKHAISKSVDGGVIRIAARIEEGRLQLSVADNGPGATLQQLSESDSALSGGVGISNVRNRLQQIYGNEHQLRFDNAASGGLLVRMSIPYVRKSE